VIPDDGGQLTRQAQAEIEAFTASRPGGPSRLTLRLVTATDQGEFLGLVAASADPHRPCTAWTPRSSPATTQIPGRLPFIPGKLIGSLAWRPLGCHRISGTPGRDRSSAPGLSFTAKSLGSC
jgi:hypothetical protein